MLSVKLNQQIKDIMSSDFLEVNPEQTLGEVVSLMIANNRSEVLVTEADLQLMGILTLTDVSRVIKKDVDWANKRVIDFAITEILTGEPEDLATTANQIMRTAKIGVLPIVREQRVLGVVRILDILDKICGRIEDESISLSLILDNLSEAVCVINNDGIVVKWSKKSEKLYGVATAEIIGKKLEDFFPNALLLKVLAEKGPIENIFHTPRQGAHVIISAIPLFIDDEFIGAVSTDRDVTEVTKLSEELSQTKDRLELLQEEVNKIRDDRFSFGGRILGKSAILRQRIERAQRVAPTTSNVLITGESGTGKEVFARAIHQASGRQGHFVAVNCSAVPENLFESEMFGYVGGAFTDALKKGKAGKFFLANGGTLFLDEIGDMPLYMQAKILRVIQERQVVPIGSDTPLDIDVRIIAATHCNLLEMLNQQLFREDLYYRLNVVGIELPPLRERKEDIPLLLKQFIEDFCQENNLAVPKLLPEVMTILMNYDWIGNIRELKNTVEHLIVFSKNGTVTLESIPENILENTAPDQTVTSYDLQQIIKRAEIETIQQVMKLVNNNKSQAAKLLNIPRSTLYYKIKYYGLKHLL